MPIRRIRLDLKKLIINSENKSDYFLLEIFSNGNQVKLPVEHKFSEELSFDLIKPSFKKGNTYEIRYSIPSRPEFGGDKKFFYIKKVFHGMDGLVF